MNGTQMTPADVVREEWHRAVREFGLRPGSPTEVVTARILDRLVVLGSGRSELATTIRTFSAAQSGNWRMYDLLLHTGDRWTKKEVYNAVAGLLRRKKLQRKGYGVYR
jgi:hypothetical protein